MAAGALNYFMSDLYPGYSPLYTRETTIAQPEDQLAMVDAAELATAVRPAQVPQQKKVSIWLTIGIILAVIIFLGGAK